MPKALVVFGSESGTAEKAIKELAAEWKKAGNWTVVDVIDGNAAAKQGLETLATSHDAIIIATSSFRQGDAPYNYDDFLGALYRATFKAESPFQGCQHAVLGFGDSHFDTYMNCPRLTDKLLGQLGASRRVQRAEVDEIDADAGDVSKQKWSDAVAKVIKSGKAAAANVCEWTQPGDTILDKHDEMLVAAATGGPPPLLFIGAALAVVAAVYFVKFA